MYSLAIAVPRSACNDDIDSGRMAHLVVVCSAVDAVELCSAACDERCLLGPTSDTAHVVIMERLMGGFSDHLVLV